MKSEMIIKDGKVVIKDNPDLEEICISTDAHDSTFEHSMIKTLIRDLCDDDVFQTLHEPSIDGDGKICGSVGDIKILMDFMKESSGKIGRLVNDSRKRYSKIWERD